MSSSSSSDSDDEPIRPAAKLLGPKRPVREVLGGGKVADVLLWEDQRVSASILAGITVIWFLFEVVEYNFVTLLCHILITTMLCVFIWSQSAELFHWDPPKIPKVLLEKSAFEETVSIIHTKLNQCLTMFLNIASKKDPRLIVLAFSLWILSLIGEYVTLPNLLFIGCLCLETLPYLYERYELDVDDFADKAIRRINRRWKKFNTRVLGRIPRGPVKEKAHTL